MKLILNVVPIVVIILIAFPMALILNMLDWVTHRGDRLSWRVHRNFLRRANREDIPG
jgi:hypothetical protein